MRPLSDGTVALETSHATFVISAADYTALGQITPMFDQDDEVYLRGQKPPSRNKK